MFAFRRLKYVADVRFSNVDKLSEPDEIPVRLCNYTDVYKNERISNDMPFLEATATSAEIRRFGLQVGDVILTKDSESPTDIAVPAVVVSTAPDLVCGYHLAVARPRTTQLNGRFLLRALQASGVREQFYVQANGVTRFGLSQAAIGNALVPVPSLDEQARIADFLDRKTASIDALIAKQEQLLALLAEKRQALITQAVTKGLDPNVPMKDTGVEVIGQIPITWSTLPIRRLITSIEQGWSPPAEDRLADQGEWAVLKLGAVFRGRFRPDQQKALSAETEPERRYEIHSGDLLVTRANTLALVGDACVVEEAPPRLMLPDLIYRLTVRRDRIDPRFLALFLLCDMGRAQIEADARGSSMSMAKVSGAHVRSWIVPVPPTLHEQQRIVEHVQSELRRIDSLSQCAQAMIEKLREYRQALITAAVTGQLDVTSGAVATSAPKPYAEAVGT